MNSANLLIIRLLAVLAFCALISVAVLMWFRRIAGSDAAAILGIVGMVVGSLSGVLNSGTQKDSNQTPPPGETP